MTGRELLQALAAPPAHHLDLPVATEDSDPHYDGEVEGLEVTLNALYITRSN